MKKIKVWSVWINPVWINPVRRSSLARPVKNNISSRQAAMELRKKLKKESPSRTFFIDSTRKTEKQIALQNKVAKFFRSL